METKKYIWVAFVLFFIGIINKIYDDMNDNHLFSIHPFLKKNKNYINEWLKGLGFILCSFVSTITPFPIFIFFIFNYLLYLWNPFPYQG
jgi:hypothetical protein